MERRTFNIADIAQLQQNCDDRDKIKLINIEGIRESACECYAAVRKHYDAMLNDGT